MHFYVKGHLLHEKSAQYLFNHVYGRRYVNRPQTSRFFEKAVLFFANPGVVAKNLKNKRFAPSKKNDAMLAKIFVAPPPEM